MAKHSSGRRGVTSTTPARLYTIEIVDADTGAIHLATDDAVAAGRRRGGRYAAVCGQQLLGASLTDPGTGYCRPCRIAVLPTQRSRTPR